MFFLVIFYGGALFEVIVVDYILHTVHWINFPTTDEDVDQPDAGDLERGSRQSLRGSKRRPSLLKVQATTCRHFGYLLIIYMENFDNGVVYVYKCDHE